MSEKSISALVGKRMSQTVKFMGQEITIHKLSVGEVLQVQEQVKSAGEDETKGFDILKTVIRASAEGAKDLSDDDFNNFPMDELSNLSTTIMKFSGIGKDSGK